MFLGQYVSRATWMAACSCHIVIIIIKFLNISIYYSCLYIQVARVVYDVFGHRNERWIVAAALWVLLVTLQLCWSDTSKHRCSTAVQAYICAAT
jgi:hypothetical protein